MSIVHLTSVHDPLDERILVKECGSLAAHGFDVGLIAPGTAPAIAHCVTIRTIPQREGRWRRMTSTVPAVLRAALASKARICHLHDPELVPAGLILKLAGRTVIYDVHENVPATILEKRWIAPALRRAIARIVDAIERSSQLYLDHFVPATASIAQRFPSDRSTLVQNFPLQGEFLPVDGEPYAQRPPHVAYLGGVTAIRGARELVRAIGLVADPRARLVLAGRFQERGLQAACETEPGWGRVDFLGWRPRTELAAVLGRARAGLVTFLRVPNHVDSQPNKLFEYMAAGIPVIASDFPLWRKIVGGEQCGLLVDQDDPAAIAGAVDWILDHPDEAEAMGRRGRAAVLARYNWESEAQKLLALYRRLLA